MASVSSRLGRQLEEVITTLNSVGARFLYAHRPIARQMLIVPRRVVYES